MSSARTKATHQKAVETLRPLTHVVQELLRPRSQCGLLEVACALRTDFNVSHFVMAKDYTFLEVGSLDWQGTRTTCILSWSIEEASQCCEAEVTTHILDTPSAQRGAIRFQALESYLLQVLRPNRCWWHVWLLSSCSVIDRHEVWQHVSLGSCSAKAGGP